MADVLPEINMKCPIPKVSEYAATYRNKTVHVAFLSRMDFYYLNTINNDKEIVDFLMKNIVSFICKGIEK